jgi:hypothetical protein
VLGFGTWPAGCDQLIDDDSQLVLVCDTVSNSLPQVLLRRVVFEKRRQKYIEVAAHLRYLRTIGRLLNAAGAMTSDEMVSTSLWWFHGTFS